MKRWKEQQSMKKRKGEAIFQEWQTVKGQLAAVSLTSGLCSWVMNQVSHPSYCKVEVKLYLHNQKFDLHKDYQASKGPWTLRGCSLHIILVVSWLTLRKCCAFTDMLIKDVLKERNYEILAPKGLYQFRIHVTDGACILFHLTAILTAVLVQAGHEVKLSFQSR